MSPRVIEETTLHLPGRLCMGLTERQIAFLREWWAAFGQKPAPRFDPTEPVKEIGWLRYQWMKQGGTVVPSLKAA